MRLSTSYKFAWVVFFFLTYSSLSFAEELKAEEVQFIKSSYSVTPSQVTSVVSLKDAKGINPLDSYFKNKCENPSTPQNTSVDSGKTCKDLKAEIDQEIIKFTQMVKNSTQYKNQVITDRGGLGLNKLVVPPGGAGNPNASGASNVRTGSYDLGNGY